MNKELLKGLSQEQIDKVQSCNSSEEIWKAAKEEGVELSDEQLEAVSGGCSRNLPCPRCPGYGSPNVTDSEGRPMYKCPACGFRFYN